MLKINVKLTTNQKVGASQDLTERKFTRLNVPNLVATHNS